MKRRRRVEFHIEHHEISVFAGRGASDAHPAPPPAGVAGLVTTATCPVCGSLHMLPLIEIVSSTSIDLGVLQKAMENGSVHMHRMLDGTWWICTESLKRR